ncbi:unnamed protein product [Cochlearia groenlandica]
MSQDRDEPEKKTYGDDDVGEIDRQETMKSRLETEDDYTEESLYSLICLTIRSILSPDSKSDDASPSLLQRIKNSVAKNGPKLREASVRTSQEILQWSRGGNSLRALLVITMGTLLLMTTMACLVFTLFFVAATVNAIIVSLLVSLAVAGGFLALFFFSLTAIYIGALSVVVFFISTATISAVVSVLIASGWIGFFYVVWLGTRGSYRLVKQSVSVMGSAVSGNGFSRLRQQEHEVNIESST